LVIYQLFDQRDRQRAEHCRAQVGSVGTSLLSALGSRYCATLDSTQYGAPGAPRGASLRDRQLPEPLIPREERRAPDRSSPTAGPLRRTRCTGPRARPDRARSRSFELAMRAKGTVKPRDAGRGRQR
jgi:hypothetical protein